MWLFEPLTTEQIITGARAQLHLSADGLALSRGGVTGGDIAASVADYAEVAEVSVGAGRSCALELGFGTGRPAWTLKGVARPQAQWAAHTIEGYRDLAAWSLSSEARAPLAPDELARHLHAYTDDLVLFGNLLVAQAVCHVASDIDLEPSGDTYDIRLRIDGTVQPVASIPADLGARLLRMFKNQAGLQAHRHDITQEGRIRIGRDGGPVDLRVTVMPGISGEKLNVRIFNPATQLFAIANLGMSKAQAETLAGLLSEPTGAIVICGPGGSGKTTTLYAALQHLAERPARRAIATIEDPVEFDLPGVSQTQVGRDLDFPKALSVLLRQDPGVIMVGEIRDPQTAQIAMRAGMSGQLLLTTIHAGGPEMVIPRLLDLGLEPYMVSSALSAIVSQRLVRTLCPACAQHVTLNPQDLAAIGLQPAELVGAEAKAAVGCPQCRGTGYIGRTGIFDITRICDEIGQLVMARDVATIRERLAGDGLRRAAAEKVLAGVTDVAEVVRVLGGEK